MDGLGILVEGNVGRRLLDDAVGNRDDELDAAVLDVKVEKKDVVDVEKVPNKGESQKKLESVRDGEQKVQKLQDEEVDAAVLDVEQEMDKGVLVGNQERNDDAEEDGDQVDDDDVYHDEEGNEIEEEDENVEFEDKQGGEEEEEEEDADDDDDDDQGSQEDYEEMQAKEKLKNLDMFAKSMVERSKERKNRSMVESQRMPSTKKKGVKAHSSKTNDKRATSIWQVTVLTVVMALGAGLGAVPFFFVKTLSSSWRGIATAIACGVMFAASFDLVHEGQPQGGTLVILGLVLGTVFIRITQHYLDGIEDVKFGHLHGERAKRLILVVGIMAAHSIGEGCGVGVSFCGENGFEQGILTTLAIGVHNIPEGLAKATVLVSQGATAQEALIWSILTCLPQPLMAVPSYAFVQTFAFLLPIALGFAAGCMIWMVFAELLPDALKDAKPTQVASAATVSAAALEGIRMMFESMEKSGQGIPTPPLIFDDSGGLTPLVNGVLLIMGSGACTGWLSSAAVFPTSIILGFFSGLTGISGFLHILDQLIFPLVVPRAHTLSAAVVGAVCVLLLRRHVILSTKLMFPGDKTLLKSKNDDDWSISEGGLPVSNRSNGASWQPDSPSKSKRTDGYHKRHAGAPLKMMVPLRSSGIVSFAVFLVYALLVGFLLCRKSQDVGLSSLYSVSIGSLFGLFASCSVSLIASGRMSNMSLGMILGVVFATAVAGTLMLGSENPSYIAMYPESMLDSFFAAICGALCMLAFLMFAVGMSMNPRHTRFGLLISVLGILSLTILSYIGCIVTVNQSMCEMSSSIF